MPHAIGRLIIMAVLLFFTVPVTVSSIILAVVAPFAIVLWLPILVVGFGIDVLLGYYLYRDFRNRRKKNNGKKEYYPMSI